MKLRLVLFLYGLPLILLTSFCSNTGGKGKKLYGVTRDYIGMGNGKTISFYEHKGHNVWKPMPQKDFKIPDNVKSMFITDRKIAIYRPNGKVEFYTSAMSGPWKSNAAENITVAKKYERILYFGGAGIGFVKGDTIDFYFDGNIHKPLKFVAPKGYKNFYTVAGEGIIVTYDKGLDLYSFAIDHQKWELQTHFNYPADMKELLPLGGDFGFGVVKDNSVDFYITRSKDNKSGREELELFHQTTFNFPK